MFGQPASWQTVCRPSLRTRSVSSRYCGPIFSLVLIHAGLRSIGVAALRASTRSSLRPSGAMVIGYSQTRVERVLLGEGADPGRERRGVVGRLQRERDDVGDLGEVGLLDPPGGQRGGADP